MQFGIIIFIILTTQQLTNGANILAVFPTPSFSHQQSCHGLGRALARKGHNVTVLTSHPGIYEPLANYNELDVSVVRERWQEHQDDTKFDLQKERTSRESLLGFAYVFSHVFLDGLYGSETFKDLIRSNVTFDLILYEGLYPAALALSRYYNYPPSVVMFSVPIYVATHHAMGNPVNPTYTSSLFSKFDDKMSFFERIWNTLHIWYELYVHEYVTLVECDKLIEKYFGDNYPPARELEKSNSIMLLSGDLSQGYPMPLQPNSISVGTLHLDEKYPPLTKELKQWMDDADKGVIYFSLGSNMRGTSLPEEKRRAFAKAFSQFPQHRVVWKWESDNKFPELPGNTLLQKWIPQQSLLAHPKVKIFITQCGHQSRQESIHFGVPALTIPLFWDQDWNGKKLETEGAGLILHLNDITAETVYENIRRILEEESFKINMERLSTISKDKPMSGTDTAVWWVEYVMRHRGAKHLRPAVQDMHWYQYLLLDVALFFMFILSSVIFITYFSVKSFLRKSKTNSKQKAKKNK